MFSTLKNGDPIQYTTVNGWKTGTFHGSIAIGGEEYIRVKRTPNSLYFYMKDDQVKLVVLTFEDNNPNKTFKAGRKAAGLATINQKGAIRGCALVLRHPYTGLIVAALGKSVPLDDLTYEQAETVIKYGDGHVQRRSGGGR
jgi:hypothetical protein